MRLIAVHLPERIVDDIERLVQDGHYPNRSETIRIAIRDLLKRELWERRDIESVKLVEGTMR
ncbi:MAG: ribbon-helix-helix domain-containing protein [Candidatus Thorarchaeota archaeon]|nr:ribbon-helix-helix domain-containing protein [Candidatus Thorarchaeota archaeon]